MKRLIKEKISADSDGWENGNETIFEISEERSLRNGNGSTHSLLADPSILLKKGMGWQRDLPDFRDYTLFQEKVTESMRAKGITVPLKEQAKKLNLKSAPKALPPTVDLRPWFSPIEDQGSLGSCTANAGVGILEYYERRAFGKHLNASRLFLYKATRNLLHWHGDTGAYLRSTMGAMALFGVPPETYWPYTISQFDVEPSAFCYAFAQNYQSIQYFRLDPPGISPANLLLHIKSCLASGVPSMFGFTVYQSIYQAQTGGKIPMPAATESVLGGHAVVAAGYNDALVIKNTNAGGPATTGAFIIRNSWGTGFGDHGYCYLPYAYVLQGLAVDWWSLLKAEWVDTNKFG